MDQPAIEESARSLCISYAGDRDPFITSACLHFAERTNPTPEIRMIRALLFPSYWNHPEIAENRSILEDRLEQLSHVLHEGMNPYHATTREADAIVSTVLKRLAHIRDTLKLDVEAAYKGDPAAMTYTEIIRAYPGFAAIMSHRVAHEIYARGSPSYARELSECSHSQTGIDIHPGAAIGAHFFIDHGTGVVIGETCMIGEWVRMYQEVTLGALHFKKNGEGELKKGYKRHPTIGNHVVIGAGAKVLGPCTIGDHVNIGANAWVQEDVPSHTTVYIAEHPRLETRKAGGKENSSIDGESDQGREIRGSHQEGKSPGRRRLEAAPASEEILGLSPHAIRTAIKSQG